MKVSGVDGVLNFIFATFFKKSGVKKKGKKEKSGVKKAVPKTILSGLDKRYKFILKRWVCFELR
jgi:hypothetical protein